MHLFGVSRIWFCRLYSHKVQESLDTTQVLGKRCIRVPPSDCFYYIPTLFRICGFDLRIFSMPKDQAGLHFPSFAKFTIPGSRGCYPSSWFLVCSLLLALYTLLFLCLLKKSDIVCVK